MKTKSKPVNHFAVAALCRANPGQWQDVGEYNSTDSARRSAEGIRTAFVKGPGRRSAYTPAGAFEARHELTEYGARVEARYVPRTNTPDVVTVDADGFKHTTITVKRACNGCSQYLGDVTDAEINRAVAGLPLLDVRAECAHCAPLVELEAQGCRTWELIPRDFTRIADEIDRLRPWVFTKGYWQTIDGKARVVGLRIGERPNHVVAYFGDWIVRHPDDTWSVHKAPVTAGTEVTA